jgi:iron complex outermembrane recepter protein
MNKGHIHTLLMASTMLAAGVALTSTAQAQTAPAEEADAGGLADIVVTARKTSENLQTTPVAVTALTAETIQSRQLVEVNDLQRATPNLSIGGAGTGPSSIVYVAIRGNAQNSPNSASDAAVGIYVDGVYYGRPIVGNLGLLDLATAEVLRGTQGTLFGRNTTGGALNLTTVQPGGKFEGYVRGSYGNYKLRTIEGAVTAPLSGEELSLRVAGRYSARDGYGYNPITKADMGKVNHDYAMRGTLRWAPESMPLKVTISGDYINQRDAGTLTGLVAVNPTGPLATLYPAFNSTFLQKNSNFYSSFGNPQTGSAAIDTPFNSNKAKGVSGTIEYDLGSVELKSITAYRKSTSANSVDLDGTPARVASFVSFYGQHQFSEEIQLSGKIDAFEWIIGGYYFKEGGTERSDSFILQGAQLAPMFFANLQSSNRNLADFDASSKALFAQVNYHLTDALRVTGGFRYTWDKRSINRHGTRAIAGVNENVFRQPLVLAGTCAVGPNTGLVTTSCNDPKSASFSYPAWTFGLDYEVTPDIFLYAKTGGAALSGGFNTRTVPAAFASFKPEKVKDVEVGFKGEFFDRHLRTNVALYHNWRNSAQNIVNEFVPGTGLTQYVRNAGDIRAYGIELEATLLPWKGMEINSAFATLKTKYASGSFIVAGVGGPVDRSGEAVPQSPRRTFNIGATQTIGAPWGSASLRMDYSYVSSRNYGQDTPDLTNPASTAAQKAALVTNFGISNKFSTLPGYGLFNMRATFAFEGTGLELALWGKNLGRKQYNQNLFNSYTGLGLVEQYQGNPRTYGMTGTFKF